MQQWQCEAICDQFVTNHLQFGHQGFQVALQLIRTCVLQWQCQVVCDQSVACVQSTTCGSSGPVCSSGHVRSFETMSLACVWSTRVMDSKFPVYTDPVGVLVLYHNLHQGKIPRKVAFTAATFQRHLYFREQQLKGICKCCTETEAYKPHKGTRASTYTPIRRYWDQAQQIWCHTGVMICVIVQNNHQTCAACELQCTSCHAAHALVA